MERSGSPQETVSSATYTMQTLLVRAGRLQTEYLSILLGQVLISRNEEYCKGLFANKTYPTPTILKFLDLVLRHQVKHHNKASIHYCLHVQSQVLSIAVLFQINFRRSSVLTKIKHGQGHTIEAKTVRKGELSEGQEPGDGEGGKCSSLIAPLFTFQRSSTVLDSAVASLAAP